MPDNLVAEKTRESRETTKGLGAELGEHDARFIDTFGNVAEKLADSISHKLHPMIEQYAQLFRNGARTPVLRRPDEVGLRYEDVFFPAADGVSLDAWFIPADSDKLLIVNHPMTCNRYGFPGHLPPWNTMFGGFEVNFLPGAEAPARGATTSLLMTFAIVV